MSPLCQETRSTEKIQSPEEVTCEEDRSTKEVQSQVLFLKELRCSEDWCAEEVPSIKGVCSLEPV